MHLLSASGSRFVEGPCFAKYRDSPSLVQLRDNRPSAPAGLPGQFTRLNTTLSTGSAKSGVARRRSTRGYELPFSSRGNRQFLNPP